MGAKFSRIKNWTTEVLTNTDLNIEIDNILNHLDPTGVDGYSATATQMRLTTDPGENGTESLATSLAGELERLRFALKEIKGTSVNYWYESTTTSLSDLSNAIGSGFPTNRISSGKTTGNSSQMVALVPSGTTTSVTLDASPTTFAYYISNTAYSMTVDTTVTGLSAGPSSSHTATIGDVQADGSQYTEFFGEYGTSINLSAAGTQFASLVGQYAAFAVNNGSATEYFVAYVNSTSSLTKAWRGCFSNSAQTAVPRIRFSNTNTVTLLKLTWLFATTSSSMAVTYSTPIYSATQPSSPSSGDYWFDFTTNTWKTFNSTSWVAANATLIGMCAQTTAACVAARTFDTFTSNQATNSVQLEWVSATAVQAKEQFAAVNIFGTTRNFGIKLPTWNMTTDLDSGLSESASTFYYCYLKETGASVISDKVPTDFRGSRLGLYHPTETWRCVGCMYNDSASNLIQNTVYSFRPSVSDAAALSVDGVGIGNYSLNATASAGAITFQVRDAIGNYPSDLIPTYINFRNSTASSGMPTKMSIRNMIYTAMPVSATLGHISASKSYVFMYAANNAGNPLLAIAGMPSDDNQFQDGTAISAGAGSGSKLYSVTSFTGIPVRYIGKAYYTTGLNGTWTNPAWINVGGENRFPSEYLSSDFGYQFTTVASVYYAMTANSVLVGPGDWELSGMIQWNGTADTISQPEFGLYGAPGANGTAALTAISSLGTITLLAGYEGSINRYRTDVVGSSFSYFLGVVYPLRIHVESAQRIYINARSTASGTGVNIAGSIIAKRIEASRT